MANYSCYIQIIQRGKGRPAVAAAAYRAGERLVSAYSGRVSDYSHKGGIVHTEILLPAHAPDEYADRAVLWNTVEGVEQRKTAWLAWEFQLALPTELSKEENIALAREFVQQSFVSDGMCADLCIHDKGNGNPHAHIMLPMRPIKRDGTWGLCWHGPDKAGLWRTAWRQIVDRYLEHRAERVS